MKINFWAVGVLFATLTAGSLHAQQSSGDKEIGIGGDVTFTHTSDFTGSANGQFSFGYFLSKRNYVGVEADPSLTFSSTNGTTSTTVSGFFGGTYRRFIGKEKGRIFTFVGGGGGETLSGTYSSGANGSSVTGIGQVFGEVGFKNYVSQKTSIEFAYRFLYEPTTMAGTTSSFASQTSSLIVVSIRHIF